MFHAWVAQSHDTHTHTHTHAQISRSTRSARHAPHSACTTPTFSFLRTPRCTQRGRTRVGHILTIKSRLWTRTDCVSQTAISRAHFSRARAIATVREHAYILVYISLLFPLIHVDRVFTTCGLYVCLLVESGAVRTPPFFARTRVCAREDAPRSTSAILLP